MSANHAPAAAGFAVPFVRLTARPCDRRGELGADSAQMPEGGSPADRGNRSLGTDGLEGPSGTRTQGEIMRITLGAMRAPAVTPAVAARAIGTLGLAADALAAGAGGGKPAGHPGAAFTTVTEAVESTRHCQNGDPDVNGEIYEGGKYAWMNGGPVGAAPGDGQHSAVVATGGQPDAGDGRRRTSPFAVCAVVALGVGATSASAARCHG